MRPLLLFLLLLPALATAQLREFEVRDQPCPEGIIQANAQYFDNALLLVYTSLPDLNFRSSLGMGAINKVNFNPTANRYEILCNPVKQMILVSSKGFVELRIATINPTPKQVICYAVEEKLSEQSIGKGTLVIDSEPEGCAIVLNELELAQTTPTELTVQVGVNRLKLRKSRYLELDTVVRVRRDEKLPLKLSLRPGWADLEIVTEPANAIVYVNDKERARGGALFKGIHDGLPPGTYRLQVVLANHRPFDRTISLKAGDNVQLTAKLAPIVGAVNLRSDPTGAKVYLNGSDIGLTPLRRELPVGEYVLKLESKGHKEEVRNIVIREDDARDLNITLRNYAKIISPLQGAKWAFFGITMAGLATGGYFLHSTITGYNAYQTATFEADALRQQVQLGDIMYPIGFAVAGAALIPTLIYHAKIRKRKKEWGLVAIPTEGGGVVGFTHDF